MGYTHYFELHSKPTDFQIASFNALVEKLIDASSVTICNGLGEDKPIIDSEGIYLNGSSANDEDYETFSLSFSDLDLNFCKTNRRPYDEVVLAILMLAGELLDLAWSSDGSDEAGDFDDARDLLKKVI